MRGWGPVLASTLVLLIAGCTSLAERRAAHEAQCKSYGFKPGTDAFANCLLKLDEPPPTVIVRDRPRY